MKKLAMAAILLALVSQGYARDKTIQVACGTKEEWVMTANKYGEELVIAAPAPNRETIVSLWVNFATGSSSWVTHVVATDEWCMTGIGEKLLIPKDSPLNNLTGTRVIYK
jgi:hypothetical protein